MGILTTSVDDEAEKRFRKLVKVKYGKKKGAIGQAISEAMEKWSDEQEDYRELISELKKGFNLGGTTYKKREELYDNI